MTRVYDLMGVGVGPFNLGLAALADGVEGLDCQFLERRPAFCWHPGLLLEGARLQVPFLADLVTLVDPTSPWSFLSYLRAHERLFPFYFAERFHVPRREYDDYCRWVAEQLESCMFATEVGAVAWDHAHEHFVVTVRRSDGERRLLARNVVIGIGTEPHVPPGFAALIGRGALHAAEYLGHRDELLAARDVTVVGSGQSGAEVVLDLLRAPGAADRRVRWLARTPAFAPMEYSKLGLEHFTPAYTDYFRRLSPEVRAGVLPQQWQLFKGISSDTIADIHDALYERSIGGRWPDEVELRPATAVESAEVSPGGGLRLSCREVRQDRAFDVQTDAVVLATGYRPRRPSFLAPLEPLLRRDPTGRLDVDESYRVSLAPSVTGRLYVQNAELHTHGVGAPDLGLGAYRSATILNDVARRDVHPLPRRTAFTSFGAPA